MIESVIFLPRRDNDGKVFPASQRVAFEQRVLAAFNGFTRQGNLQGVWQSPQGPVYLDQQVAYTVALASWRQVPVWLAIVEWALVAYRQEALYVKVAGIPEILFAGGA
jgi:hypothetical protein